jgi:hypothetical protein
MKRSSAIQAGPLYLRRLMDRGGVIYAHHRLVRQLQPMGSRCKANATKGSDR